MIAVSCPSELQYIESQYILQTVRHQKGIQPDGADRAYRLESALFDAGWKERGVSEPNFAWFDLTLQLLERGQTARASMVAKRIDSLKMLVQMRVDNRFAQVLSVDPQNFDIEAQAVAQVAMLRSRIAASPRSLLLVDMLMGAMTAVQQYEAVVRIGDRVLAQVANASARPSFYDDQDRALTWVMNARAKALEDLGRWDDSVSQLTIASRTPEMGYSPNVSQTINLAGEYLTLNRPNDALSTLSKLSTSNPRVSDYGRMQYELVRYGAALELKDSKLQADAMGYLREHRSDAEGAYELALLRSGTQDEAARYMIQLLTNPESRSQALYSLQVFIEPGPDPVTLPWSGSWNVLRSRPDVRAAALKVGRLEHFNIVEPSR